MRRRARPIVAMVGTGISPTSLPVAQEAERRQVPLVSMASSGAVVRPVDQRRRDAGVQAAYLGAPPIR
jgi:ABC-type branched-subunit amino acid transport system substrate-binding protein